MIGRLAPDRGVGVGHGAEHVVVVLEDVGVDRTELDTGVGGVLPQLAVVVDVIPRDVQRDLWRHARQEIDHRGVGDLLVRIARDAVLREDLEAGAGVAERPRRKLDALRAQRLLDVVHARLTERAHDRGDSVLPTCSVEDANELPLVVEVEDLVEHEEALVRTSAVEAGEESGHRLLPACIHVGGGHPLLGLGEIVSLDVADEQAVVASEQRVALPPRLVQGLQHLRPHRRVPGAILAEQLRSDL